jgi:hypothetical protein
LFGVCRFDHSTDGAWLNEVGFFGNVPALDQWVQIFILNAETGIHAIWDPVNEKRECVPVHYPNQSQRTAGNRR